MSSIVQTQKLGIESKLREAPENLLKADEEKYDDDEQEDSVTTEPRVVFINNLFSESGIYLPADWYDVDKDKPAWQVVSSSEDTIVRADWLRLKEEWTTDVEQPDEDDAA